MRLRVEPLPQPSLRFEDVVLVVDVIRATSTATMLLEAGARALWLTDHLDKARRLRQNGEVLVGEVGGLRPEGFDLGNSPLEARQAPVAGRVVVQSTTNGTKAAHLAAQSAREVLLAALLNAKAVAQEALRRAREEVAILCAGKEGALGLDDLYTAGVLADLLQQEGLTPVGDATRLALEFCWHHLDPKRVLSLSEAAQALERVGLGRDVAFCAQVDLSSRVARLKERRGEALVFEG